MSDILSNYKAAEMLRTEANEAQVLATLAVADQLEAIAQALGLLLIEVADIGQRVR